MSAADERLDAELSAAQLRPSDFRAVDLQAPLDVEGCIAATPLEHTAKGMFFEQLARAARKAGVSCEPRYVPFRDYPLRDFMRLVAEYGRARFPELPVREAFRRVGLEAFSTLMNSVGGKVLFAFAGGDALGALRLAPKAYKHSISPCSVNVRLSSPGQVVLEYRDVWNFPDCYQVGVIEGGCRAFGSQPHIRTRVHSLSSVDMLIRW